MDELIQCVKYWINECNEWKNGFIHNYFLKKRKETMNL